MLWSLLDVKNGTCLGNIWVLGGGGGCYSAFITDWLGVRTGGRLMGLHFNFQFCFYYFLDGVFSGFDLFFPDSGIAFQPVFVLV